MKLRKQKLPYRLLSSFKFHFYLHDDYDYLTWIEWESGKRKWRTNICHYRPIGRPRRYKINNRALFSHHKHLS